MSAAVKSKPGAAGQAAPIPVGRIEATAQVLDFEPGLYAVEVVTADTTRLKEGLKLPCIRLDSLPGVTGRAHIATLAEGAMIMPGTHPAYLRVEGTKASVLLTIYKVPGAMTAPELRVRRVGAAESLPATAPALAAAASVPTLPLTLMAHVERDGDVTGVGGAWVGQPGGGGAMEGFAVTSAGQISPADIEYQAVLGSDWNTPWVSGGNFCGSRGLALPLLGLRIRLTGEAAKKFRCEYWGCFAGRGEVGPLTGGAVCAADGAPLEALRVAIVARGTPQAAPTPASGKSEKSAGNRNIPAGRGANQPQIVAPKIKAKAPRKPTR